MELKDKVILVTGGAHRVGREMALSAARWGMNVAFTYRASAKPAEATRAEIEALGRQCLAIRCDQSKTEEIQPAVDAVIARFGRIDVLVNSASNYEQRDFFDVTPEGWDDVLNTNTRGPFFFTQAVARHMLALSEAEGLTGDGGSIVNIVDEAVHKPSVSHPDHSVSKGALWTLTRLSALRLAPKIRVNAIMPGAVLQPPDWSDERWDALIPNIPLKKHGSPQDVCHALEYLVHAEYVTGQMMVVEGGVTI
jgi:NAD(P)-dependent dehydrogenase (short-subunit alcohol dehydrogenase family)